LLLLQRKLNPAVQWFCAKDLKESGAEWILLAKQPQKIIALHSKTFHKMKIVLQRFEIYLGSTPLQSCASKLTSMSFSRIHHAAQKLSPERIS
jgi:hypothetical protein